jgi:hypothetical protein
MVDTLGDELGGVRGGVRGDDRGDARGDACDLTVVMPCLIEAPDREKSTNP